MQGSDFSLSIDSARAVDGLVVPKTFRSSYAVDVSFLGRFAPWTFRSVDVSFPGRFVPWTFRSLDVSFHGPATP